MNEKDKQEFISLIVDTMNKELTPIKQDINDMSDSIIKNDWKFNDLSAQVARLNRTITYLKNVGNFPKDEL